MLYWHVDSFIANITQWLLNAFSVNKYWPFDAFTVNTKCWPFDAIRKQAYSNILKILQPKKEKKKSEKKFWYFFIFLLKT